MADILVTNNRNPHKAVRFSINIQKLINDGNKGEEKYYLEVGTTYSGARVIPGSNATYSGVNQINIRPGYIDDITNKNIDEELSAIIGKLSSYIDWSPLLDDLEAPYVKEIEPVGDNVSMFANVRFSITDDIPTTGIDLSEMKVILNNGTMDFDITNEVVIEGDPFNYSFMWQPTIRVLN